MTTMEQRRFIQFQINEIRRYIQKHPHEDPEQVVMEWIEESASDFRKQWERHIIN